MNTSERGVELSIPTRTARLVIGIRRPARYIGFYNIHRARTVRADPRDGDWRSHLDTRVSTAPQEKQAW